MALTVQGGSRSLIGERMKMARLAKGLSTRAVAEKLKAIAPISHATLANYEKGVTRPPIDVVSAIATLYERPINWLLGDGHTLTGIRYRNVKSKVGVGDKHRFEGQAQRWFDAYIALEKHLGEPLDSVLEFEAIKGDLPAQTAKRLRDELNLDDCDPIPSVIELLEKLGIRVINIDTELALDGMAARLGDSHVVALKDSVSNDRARMNASHELGHIIHQDCTDRPETKAEEVAAFEFGSHLLLTSSMLKEALKRKSMVRLVEYKERFGISLSAIVYRAEKEELITKEMARRLWIEFSKRGWRRHEPGSVRADRPLRFESMLDSMIVEHDYTLSRLAEITGVREDELSHRLTRATGHIQESEEQHDVSPAAVHRLRLVH